MFPPFSFCGQLDGRSVSCRVLSHIQALRLQREAELRALQSAQLAAEQDTDDRRQLLAALAVRAES